MNFIKEHAELVITVCSLFITGLFWIFTISTLPQRITVVEKRVDIVENDVKALNKQIMATDTKVDLILSDTNSIKSFIMNRGR